MSYEIPKYIGEKEIWKIKLKISFQSIQYIHISKWGKFQFYFVFTLPQATQVSFFSFPLPFALLFLIKLIF